jgi:hypothetical protein
MEVLEILFSALSLGKGILDKSEADKIKQAFVRLQAKNRRLKIAVVILSVLLLISVFINIVEITNYGMVGYHKHVTKSRLKSE